MARNMAVTVATVVLLVAACVGYAAAECCTTNTIEICPAQYTFDSSRPVVCSSFGDVHIHTFDGATYASQSYGEFYLIKPFNVTVPSTNPLIVQARVADCDRRSLNLEPSPLAIGSAGTCNKGFAMSDGVTKLEFVHDILSDVMVVKLNGVLQPNSVSHAGASASVSVASRDNNGFNVDVFYNAGDRIKMKFFRSGTASISIYQRTAPFANNGGLCGFHDGCAGNDFLIRPSSPFSPPNSAIPDVTVVRTASSTILSGSLGNGNLFVNQSASHEDRDNYFVHSWRVPRVESLFTYDHGENYNLRFWKGVYDAPTESQKAAANSTACKFIGYNVPTFITEACHFDFARNSNMTTFIAGDVQRELFFDYCSFFCERSIFPFAHVDVQPQHCNGVCQYADGTVLDLHGPYTSTNLPPVSITNPTTPSARFTSSLNLAGRYSVLFTATDRCDTRTGTVNLTLECTGGFGAEKVNAGKPRTIQRGWYSFPMVSVFGTAPGNAHRVSWKMIEWPGHYNTIPVERPILNYNYSRHASFIPTLAGDYVVQFAVFDGCRIHRSEVVITAACAGCKPAAVMQVLPLKYIMWGLDFDNAQEGPVIVPGAAHYDSSDLTSMDPTSQGFKWSHDWAVLEDNNPLSNFTIVNATRHVVNPNHKQYIVNRYFDMAVADLQRAFPEGREVSRTVLPERITFNDTIIAIEPAPLRRIASKGPIGTQFGVFPPQTIFNITRDASRYTRNVTTISEEITVVETAFATSFPWCQIDIYGADQTNASLVATPLVDNSEDLRFVRGQGCVGEYNLQLTLGEPFCAQSRDNQHVEVSCGPAPEAYVSCPESVKFDYATKTFPSVTIKGSASVDPLGRGPLRYMWYFTKKPEGTNLTNAHLCNGGKDQNGCLSADATFTPDHDGPYTVMLSVSNGCNNASSYAQLFVDCQYSGLTASFKASSIPYQAGVLTQELDADASSTSAAQVGGKLEYYYKIKRTADSPLPAVALPFIADPKVVYQTDKTGSQATIVVYAQGTYEIELTVAHGCQQTNSYTARVLTNCDGNIKPDTGPSRSVEWIETAAIFEGTVLNASLTTYRTSAANPGALRYRWIQNGELLSEQQIFTYYARQSGQNLVDLLVDDGCYFETKQVLINAVCKDLQPVITPIPSANVISNKVVQLSSTLSVGTPKSWKWTIISAPAGSVATLTSDTSAVAYFQPQLRTNTGDEYKIKLVISDRCQTKESIQLIYVTCGPALVAVATVGLSDEIFVSDVPPLPTKFTNQLDVTWKNNRFKQVSVVGTGSSIGTRNYTSAEFTYYWTVIEAPAGSIFQPAIYKHNLKQHTASSYDKVSERNRTVVSTTSTATTIVDQYSVVNLTNSQGINPRTAWPACFYPDLPGVYKVKLLVNDFCTSSESSVTVNALCPKPTAIVEVQHAAGYNTSADGIYIVSNGTGDSSTGTNIASTLTMDRTLWRRVRLNATFSKSATESQLSYYWSWDDERKGTIRAQENIELPYSAVASVLLPSRGTYRLLLWVTDGCESSSVSVIITGNCPEVPLDFLGTGQTNHKYVVPAEDAVQITTFELKEKSQCPTDTWTLVDFVPSYTPVPPDPTPDDGDSSASKAGATVGIVFGVLAGVGLIAVIGFCYVKRRGGSRPARDIYAHGGLIDGSGEAHIAMESGYTPPPAQPSN